MQGVGGKHDHDHCLRERMVYLSLDTMHLNEIHFMQQILVRLQGGNAYKSAALKTTNKKIQRPSRCQYV